MTGQNHSKDNNSPTFAELLKENAELKSQLSRCCGRSTGRHKSLAEAQSEVVSYYYEVAAKQKRKSHTAICREVSAIFWERKGLQVCYRTVMTDLKARGIDGKN